MQETIFEVGDLVIPNSQELALSKREANEFGIVVKVHRPFQHPKIKIFYWVRWTSSTRSYVHFDHELTLLEKGTNKC